MMTVITKITTSDNLPTKITAAAPYICIKGAHYKAQYAPCVCRGDVWRL